MYLAQVDLDSLIDVESWPRPTTASVDTPAERIFQVLAQGVRYLPIINERGELVDVAGKDKIRRVPAAQPSVGIDELSNVIECFETGWLSSQGPFISKFEENFSRFTGALHALTVSNGTVAIQLALSVLGIGPGDEVIVPDLTFAASINAVLAVGATPRLVDVDYETWTISVEGIRQGLTSKTRAILPVHLYGQPAQCLEIQALAEENSLIVVADAAEALGATYRGRPIGSQFRASTFSFFANKQITTGEGGMITFMNSSDYERARTLRDHGMSRSKRYWHDVPGFNYRMTNIQAGIGLAQLSRLQAMQNRRQHIFGLYDSAFAGHPRITLLPRNDWSTNSLWLYTMRLVGASEESRDSVIRTVGDLGYELRPGFYPLSQMLPYESFAKQPCLVSEHISRELISLPSYPDLSDETVQSLSKVLLDSVENILGV
jgi:perosamine synthetase